MLQSSFFHIISAFFSILCFLLQQFI